MSKELEEAWTTICHYNDEIIHDLGSEYVENPLKEEINIVNNALLELKAIKEAKPNEALKYINGKIADLEDDLQHYTMVDKDKCKEFYIREDLKEFTNIKQALLKAQELENKLAYFEKVKTLIRQKDCALRYFESEDCFAVRTIFSNGWYKLTPAFVDENVREEIEPLPIIEKNKKLREENTRYKEALNIIFKKRVDMWHLVDLLDQTYEMYLAFCKSEGYADDYILTQDEFNSIKEMLKCN